MLYNKLKGRVSPLNRKEKEALYELDLQKVENYIKVLQLPKSLRYEVTFKNTHMVKLMDEYSEYKATKLEKYPQSIEAYLTSIEKLDYYLYLTKKLKMAEFNIECIFDYNELLQGFKYLNDINMYTEPPNEISKVGQLTLLKLTRNLEVKFKLIDLKLEEKYPQGFNDTYVTELIQKNNRLLKNWLKERA